MGNGRPYNNDFNVDFYNVYKYQHDEYKHVNVDFYNDFNQHKYKYNNNFMILLNPEDGAPIQNVQIKGQILFKNKPFEADSMRKFENKQVGEDLVKLFGFLRELTPDESKSYIENKKKRAFKCDRCDFATNVEIALKGHQRKHESEDRLSNELGIEVIDDNVKIQTNEEIELAREEAERRHLESGGIIAHWEDENVKGAVM